MRFLYIGDMHLCDNTPSMRIDDYHQTLINKIKEIKKIARENNCTAILQGGDFLDTPRISEEMLSRYISAFNDVDINDVVFNAINAEYYEDELENIIKTYCPLIGVVGNHELYGETMKSFEKTSLAFLQKIGFMNLVTKDSPITFQDKDGTKITITGTNYDYDLDRDEDRNGYIIDNKTSDYHIHIVHGMMLKSKNDIFKAYTLTDDIIEKTQADITLCGHYHDGFTTVKKNGKYIINPGSVTRQSISASNQKRKIKVVLIDITKENGIQIKNINLKSAVPAEKVFNLEKKEEKIKLSEKLEKIKKQVEETNIAKGNTIEEIVVNIAQNKNLKDSTRDKIVHLLSDTMKEMIVEPKQLPQYTIKKLILENFQSHSYSEFEFSDGLNIFTGKSGAGKTSILRALSWIYENGFKDARRYIRVGADFCKATIILSNGYEISRIVERNKTKGFNGYEVFYPDTQTRTRTNTKELPVIQELLGFSKLVIDNARNSKSIPVNFLKQGSSWFFIGDSVTGPERAKIIGSIYGTQYVDNLSKNLEQDLRKNNTTVKEVELQAENQLTAKMQLMFVDEMQENLEKSNELIEKTKALMAKKEKLITLLNKYNEISNREKALMKFVEDTKDFVEDAEKKVEHVISINERREKIYVNVSKANALNKKMHALNDFIKEVDTLDIEHEKELLDKTAELSKNRMEIIKKAQRLQELSHNLKFYRAKGKALSTFVDETDGIENMIGLIDNTIELGNKLNLIVKNSREAIECNKKVRYLKFYIENTQKIINKFEECSEKMSATLDKKEKIEKNLQSYKENMDTYKSYKSNIEGYNNYITEKKQEYAEILKEAGHCPVCASRIEVENIPNIIKEIFPTGKEKV